jgi:diacylglycerol kinase (ATP)
MTAPRSSGPGRILRAAGYSWRGLRAAARGEAAFRQELVLAALGMPLGLWLGEGGVEKAMLTASLLLVLIVELLNSALEAVVDRIGEERHPLSGMAKDLGSAAVLLALLLAASVWSLVLLF